MTLNYDSNAILADAIDDIVAMQAELEDLRNLYRRLKDGPTWKLHSNYVFMLQFVAKLGEEIESEIDFAILRWLDGAPLNTP